ncbi:MAG: radical SAM protein [Planctomycetaceae bacterium]|nr:radical SAM protein [Planctomycetaceae bacterium]
MTDRRPPELPVLSDAQILGARGPRNTVDPFRPYHMLVEAEHTADGRVEDVATVFLSNRECPYRCLMCDLWKNTTTQKVPDGAIVTQIRHAIAELGPTRHIKLYNSGNFFDPQAIPIADRDQIGELLHDYETVIVENHPQMCGSACMEFAARLQPQLEVAMGLETSHEPTLARLNKRMTPADFAAACQRLTTAGIRVRTFILLRPPGTTEEQGIRRAIESVRFAFDHGVNCCAVIPTRAGNGMMEHLQHEGLFEPPCLASLEQVFEQTLSWQRGRVFVDLWDIAAFARCRICVDERVARLHRMNLTQCSQPPVVCHHCGGTSVGGD